VSKEKTLAKKTAQKDGRRQHGRCETENEAKRQTQPWFPFWDRAENIQ
jgi:hypothetical protein